jgi:hypothetical protein
MKYIDNFNFFELTNYMTEKEFGLCILNGKLEAFSSIRDSPVVIDLTSRNKGRGRGKADIPSHGSSSLSVPLSSSSSATSSGTVENIVFNMTTVKEEGTSDEGCPISNR